MKKFTCVFLLLLIAIPSLAFAADAGEGTNLVGAALQQSTTNVMNQLTGVAFKLLFALSLLKFSIKGWDLIADGEIEKSFATLGKYIIWVGFVVWIMSPSASPVRAGLSNGANFIQSTVDWALGFASNMSGGNSNSFDAGYIFNVGLNASHNLIVAVTKAATGSVANVVLTVAMPISGLFSALMLLFMNVVILASAGYIAIKVFMVKIDAAVVIAISPLSFALSGLDALREQGLAPFKNLLTILYRILILAAIVSAMKTVSDNLTQVLDTTAAAGGLTDIWSPISAAIFCYLILAYMAHESDGIAAGLSSGSSMFGAGNMASSVAAGVAAGAAIATGGAAAAAVASKGGQSMSDVIKSITSGGGGSVSNASPMGSARPMDLQPGPAPVFPPKAPEMSRQEARDHPAAVGNKAAASGAPSSPSAGAGESFAQAALNASKGAVNAGASPEAALAAGDTAFAGGSKQDVADAVVNAGGTHAQGNMAAAAMGTAQRPELVPPSAGGSGETAGIGGAGQGALGDTEKKMDQILDALSKPAQKPTFRERMGTLNDHMAREQTIVQANVNVHADT